MEDLIFKYLNRELKQGEWEELRTWLEADPQNKSTLNKLQSYTSYDSQETEVMKAVILQELRDKYGVMHHKVERSLFYRISRVAAVLLIAATISFVYFQVLKGPASGVNSSVASMIERNAPLGKKITTRLPDGSIVNLNSGTKIIYPEQFSGDTREVILEGEAFFDVEHNPDKPFIIKFNGDEVRVLGTSFNIRTYPGGPVAVAVATGRVSYQSVSGKKVVLEPDQMATYLPEKEALTITTVDKLQAFGWKDKIIYFKNRPFNEIMLELERWYGVKIDVKGDFTHIGTFSGEFKDETLNEVLKGLSFVYRFDFKIEGSIVTLKNIVN